MKNYIKKITLKRFCLLTSSLNIGRFLEELKVSNDPQVCDLKWVVELEVSSMLGSVDKERQRS